MLTSIFAPNRNNSYAWTNVIFLIILLLLGKIEPYAVLFGYFLETIIVGLFNILKMCFASRYDSSGKSIFFLIPFFIFHYGMFVAIQSIFAFVIFSMDGSNLITDPFHLIDNYSSILHLKGMDFILVLLFGTQLMKFIFDFVLPKKHLVFSVKELMFKPYVRIFIQQFTVGLAMFFMMFNSMAVIAAILLILLRAIVDFTLASIRDNTKLLDYLVDKIYDGNTPKEEMRKQLLLISE